MRRDVDRSQFQIRLIEPEDTELLKGFSCGDDDLDDFVRSDALNYQDLNIAQTYLAFEGERLVGYFALAADAIELTSGERRKLRSLTGVRMSGRSHPVLPAIKLARIGVCKTYRDECRGCGTHLVRLVCIIAYSTATKLGCRLLTLDAYPSAVAFYEGLGFVKNAAKKDKSSKEKKPKKPKKGQERPTSMRLDLFDGEIKFLKE